MPPPVDITGERYGRLVAIRCTGSIGGNRTWLFRCNCGTETEKFVNRVRFGLTRSCGCLMTENRKTASFKHGHARSNNGGPTPTYMSWASMIGRCYRRYHSKFPRYGAKGITVAKRWHVFENFLADMDERPPGKTLDRWPDPAGNYKPGNCRWATPKEQRDNWR